MLQLYFGSDTIAVRQAALAAFETSGATGARLDRFEALALTAGAVAQMTSAASLFGEASAFLVDTPSENSDFYLEFLKSLPDLAASTNTIIVMETSMLAPEKKKWQAATSMIEEFAAAPTGSSFDVFKMADAVSSRDKKTLWLLLTKAKAEGLAAEEIIGTLWWQLKTLRLAALTDSAAEAGMKDFPYNKAKRALTNFKAGELEALSHRLLAVYHDGHGGVRDIDMGLEEWVLRG